MNIENHFSKSQLNILGELTFNGKTLPCDVFVAERKADRTVLIFIIQEGRNRQIRRMCEAVDLEVMRLKRTEIAGVKLGIVVSFIMLHLDLL